MPTCVQLNNVTKIYGSHIAVRDLTLSVKSGEVFGLLGPNGAGKTTTLYMLAGLVRPTSGAINLFGKDLRRHFLDTARRIGVVVERPAFFDQLSLRQNLRMCAVLSGKDVMVDRALDRAGLLHAADRKAGALSQGMKQRLALAQAILTEPALLLLDEPTAGMDVESSQEILRFLRYLADEGGVTVVISSHAMHEVECLCDRVAVIKDGALVACEKTSDLLSLDVTHLDIIVDAPEAAARRLLEEAWVSGAEIISNRLIVTLTDATPHQVITLLIQAGFRITAVIPRQRTLQEYFLKAMNQ